MRTTLTIDDDVLVLAKAVAKARSVPVGKAISDLVRQGYQASINSTRVNGFTVFEVPTSALPISPERILEAQAQDDVENHKGMFR